MRIHLLQEEMTEMRRIMEHAEETGQSNEMSSGQPHNEMDSCVH